MDALDKLLYGAVDLHCHSGPSPMPRRMDHVEAARSASQAGFRAIVAKCHYHNTVLDLISMGSQLRGLHTEVFGGIALNSSVGGINPHAVDLCLKMGGRVIWFPTISSGAHIRHAEQNASAKKHFVPMGLMLSEEVDIFGSDGDLLPEVYTIIELAKESGAVITGGHLAAERGLALFEAVSAAGHTRMLVNHPNFVVDADNKQVVRFAELGVVIEHELAMYDIGGRIPFQVLLDWIDLVGPDRTSLGSDLGQVGSPLPVEAYRRVVPRLLDSGLSDRDVKMMISTNPARLLGVDV